MIDRYVGLARSVFPVSFGVSRSYWILSVSENVEGARNFPTGPFDQIELLLDLGCYLQE